MARPEHIAVPAWSPSWVVKGRKEPRPQRFTERKVAKSVCQRSSLGTSRNFLAKHKGAFLDVEKRLAKLARAQGVMVIASSGEKWSRPHSSTAVY
jgi:hypothetical protein